MSDVDDEKLGLDICRLPFIHGNVDEQKETDKSINDAPTWCKRRSGSKLFRKI